MTQPPALPLTGARTDTRQPGTNPAILVFDSGVGGLSIFEAIRQQIPGCDLTYASDNAAFPYGTKGETELVERVEAVLKQLLHRRAADIIVVACNSASTLALPHIRGHFQQPIVGVVPAIKPAALQSRSGVIGLLATPGTVRRAYTQQLIEQFASDCEVIRLGSSELVALAEAKLRGQRVTAQNLANVLQPLELHPRRGEMDTLVLACTHFPLLAPELARHFGPEVQLIDSGDAIARRVHHWIGQLGLAPGSTEERQLALFTAPPEQAEALQASLRHFGLDSFQVESVPL